MARFTTERGLDRLVNFSDATVAIALTLLVLPLTDLAGAVHGVPAAQLIGDNREAFFAFLVSFVVIAGAWLEHHRLFESLSDYDMPLMLVNIGWLLAVVALPFTTELNQQAPAGDRVAVAIYTGNLFVQFAAIAAMRLIVVRPGAAVVAPPRREQFRVVPSLVIAGLCAVAVIIAVSIPAAGMWAIFIIAFTGPVTRLVRKFAPSR